MCWHVAGAVGRNEEGHGLKLFRLERYDYTPLQTRHENGELDDEL
jgi:hypothetical protein